MCLAMPSFLTWASAPNVSASGTCGFGQCSSNRSTSESRSFVRLSLVDRSRSFGAKWVVQTLVVTNNSQRLLDQARAGSPAQFPGAQPDRGDFCAIGLNELHRGLPDHTRAFPFR